MPFCSADKYILILFDYIFLCIVSDPSLWNSYQTNVMPPAFFFYSLSEQDSCLVVFYSLFWLQRICYKRKTVNKHIYWSAAWLICSYTMSFVGRVLIKKSAISWSWGDLMSAAVAHSTSPGVEKSVWQSAHCQSLGGFSQTKGQ